MAKREPNPCALTDSSVAPASNACRKRRPLDDPYEVWVAPGWEWRVLKKYQSPSKEADNPYARWFCAVKSPMTHGSWDMGDCYCHDIMKEAAKVEPNNVNVFQGVEGQLNDMPKNG